MQQFRFHHGPERGEVCPGAECFIHELVKQGKMVPATKSSQARQSPCAPYPHLVAGTVFTSYLAAQVRSVLQRRGGPTLLAQWSKSVGLFAILCWP